MANDDRYVWELNLLRRLRDYYAADLAAAGRTEEAPDDLALTLIADTYFRLRDAYMKHRRPGPDHFSRLEKIAALSTLSVMLVSACEVHETDPGAFKINPVFALRCGFARVKGQISDLDIRTIERMSGWLNGFKVGSAATMLDIVYAARADGQVLAVDDAPLALSASEVFDIDMLVSFFAVVKRLVDKLRPSNER